MRNRKASVIYMSGIFHCVGNKKSESERTSALRLADDIKMSAEDPSVDSASVRSQEGPDIEQSEQERSSDTPSQVSMKSDGSIFRILDFRGKTQEPVERSEQERSDTPSQVSMKSDGSIFRILDFRGKTQEPAKRDNPMEDSHGGYRAPESVCERHGRTLDILCQTENMLICSICVQEKHKDCRKTYTAKQSVPGSKTILLNLMENMGKEELENFKRQLLEDYPGCFRIELSVADAAVKIVESFGGETALRILLNFQTNGKKITDLNKSRLKRKCERISEGNSSHGQQKPVAEIYTHVNLTVGRGRQMNNEHEVLRNEIGTQGSTTDEVLYQCNDIFKKLPGHNMEVRTALTMGIAGIGKHVSVKKFILDWADGKANQDIECIIHLPFQELHHGTESCSLLELLHHHAPELKEADLPNLKVLFILEGLDLCRYPLDFHKNINCFDVKKQVPFDELLTNLIMGNLLPSALLWITTRPSAANRIPPEYVHRITEICGFGETEKEEYFRRKIGDQILASKIIAHLKSCRSLYIMCHMPIFCWISATVLENVMSDKNSEEIPRTLTEMFTHLLLIQISLKHKKFNGADASNPKKLSDIDKSFILNLGKLAFQQMEKRNFVFTEEDLRKGGIDVSKVQEYSLCTEMFRVDLGLYREKVYVFEHACNQEFLAAIYAHFACVNNQRNVFDKDQSKKNPDLSVVHQMAIDKAWKSENGHLDLFLRFFLGLSVTPNCGLLKDLLNKKSSSKPPADKTRTVNFIHEKIKQEESPDKIINLFHCLNELNDHTLVKAIQAALKSGTLLGSDLEPEQWSALAYVYLKSEEELDVFDTKSFQTTMANQLRLLPVLRICKKARLDCCNLSEENCRILVSALETAICLLTELELSNSKLEKYGLHNILESLKSPHCCIKKLGFAGCYFPSPYCEYLTTVLKSPNSQLRELDLSYNKFTVSGINKLCVGLSSESCKLEKLKLKQCDLTAASCTNLGSVLKSNRHLKDLDLEGNDLEDTGVNHISSGLKDPMCTLKKLGLSGCMVTELGCRSLALALTSNPDHLRELDLTYNNPGDEGMKILSRNMERSDCKLEKLDFDHSGECRIKPGLGKYACRLEVDINTIHSRLELTNGNRTISETEKGHEYPNHEDRYSLFPQVLCMDALKGRSYFELEYVGSIGVGVTYKTSDRTDNLIGINNKFPSLLCYNGKLKLWQNNEEKIVFPVFTQSRKVGVYVDWDQGSLSYYSVCKEERVHLHTHHTQFNAPLYVGFIFMTDSSVSLGEVTDT